MRTVILKPSAAASEGSRGLSNRPARARRILESCRHLAASFPCSGRTRKHCCACARVSLEPEACCPLTQVLGVGNNGDL